MKDRKYYGDIYGYQRVTEGQVDFLAKVLTLEGQGFTVLVLFGCFWCFFALFNKIKSLCGFEVKYAVEHALMPSDVFQEFYKLNKRTPK